MEGLMTMSPQTGWKVTPIRLEEDVEKQMKELKTRAIKNIVVYMHVEENIKRTVEYVSWTRVTLCVWS